MRPNRVDPLGALHAVPDRGAWMGNRGCLHDPLGRIVRGHAGRRWITCAPEFRGRRRALMTPGRYTELFFLDEATAYAAGHRPCAECRRADYLRFSAVWAQVHGPAGAEGIDAALHLARLNGRSRRLGAAHPSDLPPGAMVLLGDAPALVSDGGAIWRWSFRGYSPGVAADTPLPAILPVITPAPVIALLRAGLPVQMALPPRAPAVSPLQT